jgi:hypothetical protein
VESKFRTQCMLHDLPKVKGTGGWCKTCQKVLRAALSEGGDEGAHNTRMELRVERWKKEGLTENIKEGMVEVAKEGMKWVERFKVEEKSKK